MLAWNKAPHPEHEKETQFIRDIALLRMKDLYNHKEHMLSQDQYIFRTPLPNWKRKPLREIEKWIHTHSDLIRHCRQLATNQL